MTRRKRTPVQWAVEATKVATVAALCGVALAGLAGEAGDDGATAAATARPTGDDVLAGLEDAFDRMMERHSCSTTGFGPDVIPGSALVVRDHHLRHVSFDDGWATWTGDAPGELVAVCRVDV